METGKVVFVPCTLHRGGFPGERVFVIPFKNGAEFSGVAPVRYCFTLNRRPVGERPDSDDPIEGLVLGVVIGQVSDEILRVYLPDGDIYELGSDNLASVRKGDAGHVPV